MDIQELFKLGMKRELPQLLDFPEGPVLNLGCGNSPIPGAINLDLPEWDGDCGIIEVPSKYKWEWVYRKPPPGGGDVMVTCPDNVIAGIHCYHLLEHLKEPRDIIREMQRVLIPGGVANIVVPHFSSAIAYEDLDHKHQFALETWRVLFDNPHYNKQHHGWKMRVHFNALMAVAERNTVIVTQLVKEG